MPPEPAVEEPLGLRERKRLATRQSILRAALQVVRERGLDGATIDEISRVADISPRTFFNYFPSKEEAILGETPTLKGNPELEWFLADRGPILHAMARVIVVGVTGMLADPELLAERRELSRLYPELGVRRMASVHRFEEELTALAAQRLETEHPEWDAATTGAQARLVALTGWAFIRHAWFSWLEHPDDADGLAEEVERSFALGARLIAEG